MELPEHVPLAHTMAWLDRALPGDRGRLLEVGCGRGVLAAELARRGASVTAIDVDAEAVAACRARGVPAIEADFLGFDGGGFDTVLFQRSLHHLHPLEAAIARARDVLRPGGALVLEEFAWERADAPTAAWFDAARVRLAGEGRLAGEDPAPEADPLRRWVDHHVGHDVHHGSTIREAVGRVFAIGLEEEAPYLYRWFAARLPGDPAGAREAAALLEGERRGIAEGGLRPIGLRLAARRV